MFKYVSGTGTSATVANGKTILAYAKADDGTDPNIVSVEFGGDVVDDTSPQLGGNLDVNFMILILMTQTLILFQMELETLK